MTILPYLGDIVILLSVMLLVGNIWLMVRCKQGVRAMRRRCEQGLAEGEMIVNGQIPPRYQGWVDHYQTLQTDEERDHSIRQFLHGEEEGA